MHSNWKYSTFKENTYWIYHWKIPSISTYIFTEIRWISHFVCSLIIRHSIHFGEQQMYFTYFSTYKYISLCAYICLNMFQCRLNHCLFAYLTCPMHMLVHIWLNWTSQKEHINRFETIHEIESDSVYWVDHHPRWRRTLILYVPCSGYFWKIICDSNYWCEFCDA